MIPSLMHRFGLGAAGISLITAMYYYAYTPLQALVGVLTDYFGPKRILTVAIGLCVIGALVFGTTSNPFVAGLGRFLIGAGSAFAFVGVLKFAAMWLPKNRFALFVGLTTGLGMFGAMIGDDGLMFAVAHIGWQRVMIFSALFGVILIPIFMFYVHENKAKLKNKSHMVHTFRQGFEGFLRAIRSHQLILAGVIGSMLYLSLSVFAEFWGIPFLKATNSDHSGYLAANMNSMVFLGWMIGAPFNGWLSDRLQTRRLPLIIGNVLAAAAISSIIIWPHMPATAKFAVLILFGLFSSVEIICFTIARDIFPLKFSATAIAVVNLFTMLGGMIFQPGVGWLVDFLWRGKVVGGLRVYSVLDYQHALIVIPVAMLCAAVLSAFLTESYHTKVKS